jgi:hypothetical protein
MALPSLAAGIGLQGKPIDRAQLNYQRELGAERALARKEQEKQKRREPYVKAIMDLSKGARIPFQDVLLQKQVGDFMVSLEDNLDNANYAEISQGFYNIGNTAAKYNQNWKDLQKLKIDPKYKYMSDVWDNISSVSDQDALQSFLSTRAGAQGGINPDGTLAITPYKYSPVANTVQSLISEMDNNGTLFQGIDEAMVAEVGGQKFAVKGVRDNVSGQLFEAIKTTPDFYNSAQDQVYKMLAQQQSLPDLNTEEGQQQFTQKVDEFIAQDVNASLDKVFNERAISKGNGITINNNLPSDPESPLQPIEGNVIVNYGGVPFSVKVAGGLAYGDKKVTFPTTDETVYAEDGKRPKNLGDEITTNYTGAAYTLDKDFVTPFEAIITNDKGQTYTIPKGTRFAKGALVPLGYERDAMQAGASFSPKVVAFGKVSNSKKWIVQPANKDMQARYLSASAANKKVIEDAVIQQDKLKKDMSSWNLPEKMIEADKSKGSPTQSKVPSKWQNTKRK